MTSIIVNTALASFGIVLDPTTLNISVQSELETDSSTAVPEPGTLLLLAAGLAGVSGVALRRRARHD